MVDWCQQTETLTLKGKISLPYNWWVGETGSRFLAALRDTGKIWGNRCHVCGTVFVPPRRNCGRCFVNIDDWVELGDEGIVTCHTIVRFPFELHPAAPPFAYALIKLDGADVSILHIIKNNMKSLRNGVRVKAVLEENRSGHILDIDCFRII